MGDVVERPSVGNRFAVESLVGKGGMGDVYRGTDLVSHTSVALKFLRAVGPAQLERFNREAAVLAELEHPAIVRYIAHGVAEDGQPYLAVEWLDGETLDERLRRGPLSAADALALLNRILEGLAVAHARGVIHRDLKPSNLLLVGGQVEATKILDFGIAKRFLGRQGPPLTQSGTRLGTPAYMSPEQARGTTNLHPSTDVFSLGAVLYECLTGQRAFRGHDALAVIAEICLQEAALPRSLRPEIPVPFERLVMRMLAKREASRPRDALELQGDVAAMGLDLPRPSGGSSIPPSLAGKQQRVLTLVLIDGIEPDEAGLDEEDTVEAQSFSQYVLETRPDAHERAKGDPTQLVTHLLAPYAGHLEHFVGGGVIVHFAGTASPTDLATRAARFALAVASAFPRARVAVCTGRATPHEPVSIGELVDDAAPMLDERDPGVHLDSATAELVRARFVVDRTSRGAVLRIERESAEATRTLLGKPSPFVGRKRELELLGSLFDACEDDALAQAALVVAAAGTGKSRLWQEAVHALVTKSKRFQLLVGRGDAVHVGAPFGLLGTVLRSTSAITRDDDAVTRQLKLRERVESRAIVGHSPDTAPFLGEMAGIPFPDSSNAELRNARRDARVMGERTRTAWLEWIGAELSRQPVVLVLDDLQWGDLQSVELVDAALHHLSSQPLFVLALARPEVVECFPRLWEGHRLAQVHLRPLTKRASTELIREVLGGHVDPTLVERLVSRGEGNPFFLEELLRAVDAGRTDALPDGVMAMVQARLDLLGAEAGRILRAASIFGDLFAADGVAAMVASTVKQVEEALVVLEQREVVTRCPETGEYAFRHALVRETCYAALTPEDRLLGHRLASEWLEAGARSSLQS